MAAADYRLCDVCGGKTFYDANLNYDQGADVEGSVRNSGVMMQNTCLDYLGDWCVICQECAKTHECQVAQKDTHATAARDAEVEALRAEVERLREIMRPKREKECLTLYDWRTRAYYLEENWSRCSRACAVEQTKRERAEARAEQLEEALRYAVKQVPELATVPGIAAALEQKE